jgi:hypothetical protein
VSRLEKAPAASRLGHDAKLRPSRLAGLRGIVVIESGQPPHHVCFRATQIKVNLPTTIIVESQHSCMRLPPQQCPHRRFWGRRNAKARTDQTVRA